MSQPWTCYPSLPRKPYANLLRRAIFECNKWHTQTDDQPVICPFPLVLSHAAWQQLTLLAAELAKETLAAEKELLIRTELHERLGLPRALRRCLRRTSKEFPTQGGARVMRFDFHWTTDGWRISEANTDVAGGFIEASGVTKLLALEYPDCEPAGDPAGALSEAVRRIVGAKGMVGLMHLPIYSEDRQVMLYLVRRLEETGLSTCLFSPEQLRWSAGQASVDCAWYAGPIDLLIRFFPAEWLPRLSWRTKWAGLIVCGRTKVCNPAYAVLTQSKRFPLVWDALSTPLPIWRSLLPETLSPRTMNSLEAEEWVLKPALGHEGQNVAIRGVNAPADWQRIRDAAVNDPDAWAAQRRFAPLEVATPEGPLYPCLGVYVIDGQVAGAYGRAAARPLIDDRSRDLAILVKKTNHVDVCGPSREVVELVS